MSESKMNPYRHTAVAIGMATAALLTSNAQAQTKPPLNDNQLKGAAPYGNPIEDDRLYGHVLLDQFEQRFGNGKEPYTRWDGQAWIGNDFHRLWIKSEGRANADGDGKIGDGKTEVLYDRPITPFFDLQAGVRYDLDSKPGRGWAALGIQGLAVGFWNVSATAYVGGNGRLALNTNASYDYYITQRLVLQPQFETNWYSKEDYARRVGSGLSDIDSGLRFRYEISRKFAPYIGVTYQKWFGNTADIRQQNGSPTKDFRVTAGLRLWF